MANLYRTSQYIAWGAMILLLPITSLGVLARWVGASAVALPSALPLLWLVLVWFLPFIFRRGTVSRQAVPFLVFLAVALIASAGAYFINTPPFKGATLLSEELVALLTLSVGASFYLVVASWPRSSSRLQLTLQLINISGLLLIGWSLVQAYYILFHSGHYPGLVVQIQDWVSRRDLFQDRVTGFAFEPSWLAHQLNVLYLPIWLAASITRYSAHRRRILGLSAENILLVMGVLILFLSSSRIGILAALLMVTCVILPATYRLAQRATRRLSARSDSRTFSAGSSTAVLAVALFGLFVAAYVIGLIGLVYGVSRYDPRLAALFEDLQWDSNGIFSLANQLAFAERLVYWATGWQIFNDYPILGVGLGNAGFFFPERMPPFGWALWEVSQIFYHLSNVPNTKSIWARLLAETGWVGFSVFITWLYVLWRSARALVAEVPPLLKTVGLAGLLALIVFLVEGFSIDSFAMPYLWVSAGLLTAGVSIKREA
jgi:O-Antigen ligase